MNKKRQGGFTLVELIVVIAILGILAGVGTVAYTGYVEKANKAVDQQLVADVAYAMQLAYASGDLSDAGSGYVILGSSASASGEKYNDAMERAFGEGWQSSLQLRYDWSGADNGILQYVIDNASTAQAVADSTYLKKYTPADLVKSIDKVTGALSGMASTATDDPLTTIGNLGVLEENQLNSIRSALTAEGLSWATGADNTAYSTMLSNLLVKEVSNEVGNSAGENTSGLSNMAAIYAMVYGWAATDADGQSVLDNLNAVITDENSSSSDIVSAFNNLDFSEGSKLDTYNKTAAAGNDANAFYVVMKALDDVSDSYDITASGVFSGSAIGNQVNDYVNSVAAVAGLDDEQINALSSNDGVTVFVAQDGTVSVVPAEAGFGG